jgi:hypothetical protein
MSEEWVYPYFDVKGLPSDALLANWRWLCPQDVRLVAVDAFGDLFLEDSRGAILRLDVCGGQLQPISESRNEFVLGARSHELRKKWFYEDVAVSLGEHRLSVSKGRCLGYKTPIVFVQSTGDAANVYAARIEEYVPFLGDLHFQMRNVPEGGRVRLIVGRKPDAG